MQSDAPLGQLRCDPPITLLEALLGKLQVLEKQGGKFDAIIVPGDLVAHGVPLDPANPDAGGDYELVKETQR